ncbi:MAG: DNA polymerase III subunit delta, partial [Chitinophagaceae bacterium]|nr:DNA polymerase III subunit delta [Chitinophagaceae bacterium]
MIIEKIIAGWKSQKYKPVYWLQGEEEYYIDQLMSYAEHSLLTPAEAEFNLTIFYGKDANWTEVINACMRYPMFSQKQVVLLKEAQQMKEIEKLGGYLENPLLSTILVISYKGKTLDKRKSLAKTLNKHSEIVISEKIYDSKLNAWATDLVQLQGLTIAPRAVNLLVDHIGNDLSRIANEVEKVTMNLGHRKNITEDDVENYVGISKEYNVFELQQAISNKDLAKAITIIQYFEANPKA